MSLSQTADRRALGTMNQDTKLPAPKARTAIPTTTTSRGVAVKRKAVEEGDEEQEDIGESANGAGANVAGANVARKPAVTVSRVVKPAVTRASAAKATVVAKPAAPTATTKSTLNKTTGNAGAGAGAGAAQAGKRAAWDYKGRLEDLEKTLSQSGSKNAEFMEVITQQNDRIQRLEEQRVNLESNLTTREVQSSAAEQRVRELEMQLSMLDSSSKREISGLNDTLTSTKFQRDMLEKQLHAEQEEVLALKASISKMASDSLVVEAQLRSGRAALDAATATIATRDTEIARLNAIVAQQIKDLEAANVQAQYDETMRRKLHNTILELKGNIRVFCRVRPQGASEGAQKLPFAFPDARDQKLLTVSAASDANYMGKVATKDYEFSFDKVFGPASTQEHVFEEITQLVQSALDGYNVTIFAYGQTGSGKTHTMEGGTSPNTRGMIPRAVDQIFETAAVLKAKGWKYTFSVSFLEIYNETLRDLLGSGDSKHEIKRGRDDDDVMVTDLTEVEVTHEGEIASLLSKANSTRAVAKTDMNERSSRSHSVFRLRLVGTNPQTEESCRAMLNLVDLAGSERLARSGATGDRLKETQNINTSLASLGNVIMALSRRDAHVPFRDSKLTYLLQPSLSGQSKTLMFVNVSPAEESVGESLCSLRFATKVNECTIGTARKAGK